MKELNEKRIELYEIDNYGERRNRRFRISYVKRGDVVRYEKIFQKKVYLNQLLEDPNTTKVKVYVGDVIERERVS